MKNNTQKIKEEIRKILEVDRICGCVDDYTCVICKAINKAISKIDDEHKKEIKGLNNRIEFRMKREYKLHLKISDLKHQLQKANIEHKKEVEEIEKEKLRIATNCYLNGQQNAIKGMEEQLQKANKKAEEINNILENRKRKLTTNYKNHKRDLDKIPNKRKEISIFKLKSRIKEIEQIKKQLRQKHTTQK